MDFYVFGTPVPGAIDLGVGGLVAAVFGAVAALAPMVVAVTSVVRVWLRELQPPAFPLAGVRKRLNEHTV